MTRWTLRDTPKGRVYLHVFHRSDNAEELHDHPWDFTTWVLWKGYNDIDDHGRATRIKPFRRYRREARHIHRVELIDNRPAVTLVFTGPQVRRWGFWVGDYWYYWREYVRMKGCIPIDEIPAVVKIDNE